MIQTVLYVLVIVAAILLILIILPQSNKGSDIGLFGGSTDMVFGSQKGNILTRTTSILATIVIGGVFLMSVLKVYLTDDDKKKLLQKEQSSEVKTLSEINQASVSSAQAISGGSVQNSSIIQQSSAVNSQNISSTGKK